MGYRSDSIAVSRDMGPLSPNPLPCYDVHSVSSYCSGRCNRAVPSRMQSFYNHMVRCSINTLTITGLGQQQFFLPKIECPQMWVWPLIGASGMTTELLTIKFANFPIFWVMEFPKKNSILGHFSLIFAPSPTPFFINIVR